MKRFFLTLSLCLAAVVAVAQNDKKTDWAQFYRYAEANKTVTTRPDAVFMGNSITDGWASQDPEFFKQNNFVGRGISGQTSSEMLVRFRRDVIDLNPKCVVILSGTNDIAQNNGAIKQENTLSNIISMCELAKANGIKVILTSVLPSSGFRWNKKVTDAADRIEALNAKIKAYAKENKIPYVDYYTPMVSGAERALNPAYSNDGVHPTLEGYLVMEALIKPAIEKAL